MISDIRGIGDIIDVLLLGVSLAVAAVQEGLPAILSVVLALGCAAHGQAQRHRQETLVGGNAEFSFRHRLQQNRHADRAEMTIVRVMTASGSTEITGVGYAPDGQVKRSTSGQSEELSDGALRAEQIAVLSGGSLAGNAQLRQEGEGPWEVLGDPTEAAFLVAERKLGVSERREKRFERTTRSRSRLSAR